MSGALIRYILGPIGIGGPNCTTLKNRNFQNPIKLNQFNITIYRYSVTSYYLQYQHYRGTQIIPKNPGVEDFHPNFQGFLCLKSIDFH